jgi:NTP pyrophosphatase (non-canonical NTP hydrolase)
MVLLRKATDYVITRFRRMAHPGDEGEVMDEVEGEERIYDMDEVDPARPMPETVPVSRGDTDAEYCPQEVGDELRLAVALERHAQSDGHVEPVAVDAEVIQARIYALWETFFANFEPEEADTTRAIYLHEAGDLVSAALAYEREDQGDWQACADMLGRLTTFLSARHRDHLTRVQEVNDELRIIEDLARQYQESLRLYESERDRARRIITRLIKRRQGQVPADLAGMPLIDGLLMLEATEPGRGVTRNAGPGHPS